MGKGSFLIRYKLTVCWDKTLHNVSDIRYYSFLYRFDGTVAHEDIFK